MSGHTPGPWAKHKGQEGRWFVTGPAGFVCTMDTPEHAVQEANAAYIVHACNLYPELLDAAKTALELLECIQDEEGHSPSVSVPAHNLRTAIAKATGSN